MRTPRRTRRCAADIAVNDEFCACRCYLCAPGIAIWPQNKKEMFAERIKGGRFIETKRASTDNGPGRELFKKYCDRDP